MLNIYIIFNSISVSLIRLQNHVDVLRMELDNFEWGVLDAMLDQGEMTLIKQLYLHVNIRLDDSDISNATIDSYIQTLSRNWKVLKRLENEGFQKWRSYAVQENTYISPVSGKRRPHKYIICYVKS